MEPATVERLIARLLSSSLVEMIEHRYRLTALGKVAGELGIQVESVVRIARALKDLPSRALTGTTLLAATQTSVELDDVYFPVHKSSMQERARWQGAVDRLYLPPSVTRGLRATDDSGYTARCKRLSAVLMWIDGIELERLEASLLRHLPNRDAAGPIRSTAERTRDLLGVALRIYLFVSKDLNADLEVKVKGLTVRLELGIPEDMVWLAAEVRRDLTRGDYLKLRRAGLTTLETIDALDHSSLSQIIGNDHKAERIRDAVEKLKESNPDHDDDSPMPRPTDPH